MDTGGGRSPWISRLQPPAHSTHGSMPALAASAAPAAGGRGWRRQEQKHHQHLLVTLLLLSLLLPLAAAFHCHGVGPSFSTTTAAVAAAAARRVYARPALHPLSHLEQPSRLVGRLAAAGADGEGDGSPSGGSEKQPPSSPTSSEEGGGGGFLGSGLSTREALISTLGITPLTLLLAVAALGMAGANALYGPGWLRPSLGLKPTTFQSRNLVLPLDQEGMLFPLKGQGLDDVARAWERE